MGRVDSISGWQGWLRGSGQGLSDGGWQYFSLWTEWSLVIRQRRDTQGWPMRFIDCNERFYFEWLLLISSHWNFADFRFAIPMGD